MDRGIPQAGTVVNRIPCPGHLSIAVWAAFACLVLCAMPALAQVTPEASAGRPTRDCVDCHDDDAAYAILKTKHGVTADRRTPFGQGGCISCHGASIEHSRRARGNPPDVVFGDRPGSASIGTQNTVCLDCHESGMSLHWRGSAHEAQDLACTSCHALHSEHDPVLSNTGQTDLCLSCHREKRAELHRPSTHPLLDGQMACSDCHNAHGGSGPALLAGHTINESCYGCHAEKRGPFLWEHAPVREDCTICHRPHGSTQVALLKAREPWLCQQCHLEQQHPSTAYSGTGLPGATVPSGAQQLLGRSCGNCHAQVHGSNHPSGVGQTR